LAGARLTIYPDPFAGKRRALSCTTGLVILPGSGSTTTTLPLAGDAALDLVLPFQFWYFDVPYADVWVSANGYVTFGAGNTAAAPSAAAHYALPRLAVLFDDLLPAPGAAVLVDEVVTPSTFDTDRVAITWTGWQDASGPVGDFQLVLDEDGTISYSYAAPLTTSTVLVGISSGGGGMGTAVDLAPPGGC
jgi:hypothetical protein